MQRLGKRPFVHYTTLQGKNQQLQLCFVVGLGKENATCNAVQQQLSFTKNLHKKPSLRAKILQMRHTKQQRKLANFLQNCVLRLAVNSTFFTNLQRNETIIAPLPTNFANSRLRACVFNKDAPPFALQIATVVYGVFACATKCSNAQNEAQFCTTGAWF